MCDTIVFRRNDTTLFAKNSDREPGEAQLVVRIPPAFHKTTNKTAATHIAINQADRSHGVLLSKPFWTWGAEMGANDKGVVIGNEAVFTRVMEKTDGLIGMDLVRLGLERGDTARHALQVITQLLEAHGQGGICGYRDRRFRYDNSFIIADACEAWVLETAGRHWAARRAGDFAAISNCLTIGADYDMVSSGIESYARKKRLLKGNGPLNFRETFEAPLMPLLAKSRSRMDASLRCIRKLLSLPDTDIKADLSGAMEILRFHRNRDQSPAKGSNADICMHAAGPIRRSQTCGSMVSAIGSERCIHLLTGTSAPCLSVFKPVQATGDRSCYVLNPDERSVENSLWRRFEPVHRHALFSDSTRRELRGTAKQAESEMLTALEYYYTSGNQSAMNAAEDPVRQWTEKKIKSFSKKPFQYPFSLYGRFWKRMNRADNLTIPERRSPKEKMRQ